MVSIKKYVVGAAMAIAAAMPVTQAYADSHSEGVKIAVIGGSNEDAFWNLIKKGIDDARLVVEANGGEVNYLRLVNYDNFAPDVVQLIRTAIGQEVDGLVIPNWVPEAEDPAIRDAIEAGIQVILMNAGGIDKANELGAINYVGSDEYEAGFAGGKYFVDNGQTNVICVNQIPGAANLEDRCRGVADGAAGIAVAQLPLPANLDGNMTGTAEAIRATLLQNPDIDGVITLSAGVSDAAALAIQQAGRSGSVTLGTFDMSQAVLSRIQSGEQTFAIDQQPYLQSLLAVTILHSALRFGTDLPTTPVLTGPGIVDASNIETTLAGVALGAR
jgi:simple sugar transport system substrate-binding protein